MKWSATQTPSQPVASAWRAAASTSDQGWWGEVHNENRIPLACQPAGRARAARRVRVRGAGPPSAAQALDHVVDAGGQRLDVRGVDRRVERDAELVAAQLAVALGVDDEVVAQHRGDLLGVDRLVEVDRG